MKQVTNNFYYSHSDLNDNFDVDTGLIKVPIFDIYSKEIEYSFDIPTAEEIYIDIYNDKEIKEGIYSSTLRNELIEFEEYIQAQIEKDSNFLDKLKEAERENKNNYKRVARYKKHLIPILESNKAIFVTFTFNDECLDNTSMQTRRNYVSRFLSEHCDDYLANIDFGSVNEREHYHALVIPKNDKLPLDEWNKKKRGSINVKRVSHMLQENNKPNLNQTFIDEIIDIDTLEKEYKTVRGVLLNDNRYYFDEMEIEEINGLFKENNIDSTANRLSKYICKLSNHAFKETTKRLRVIYPKKK